jgi:hypothetical protein
MKDSPPVSIFISIIVVEEENERFHGVRNFLLVINCQKLKTPDIIPGLKIAQQNWQGHCETLP